MIKDFGLRVRGFFDYVCHIVENSEIVKASTAPTRELNFQGLEGFGSVYFCCFLGFGFWMALGMNFK